MNIVHRTRHRFADQIITLLLADLKEHGVVFDDLPAVRMPGDDWRDAANLSQLPSDAARDAALQVADALDELRSAESSDPGASSQISCAWCGRERTDHGPDRLCPGTTSSFYTIDSKNSPPCGHRHGRYGCTMTWCGYGVPAKERQVRDRWHQIFKNWHSKRDRAASEMKSEQDQIDARMTMAACLMEVFLELEDAGSNVKKSFSMVTENPDGTATVVSMLDATPFLRDLKTLVSVPPEFDAKAVAGNVLELGKMESLRVLHLLGPLCQDQIQEALGLPRDPDTVEAVKSLLLLRGSAEER